MTYGHRNRKASRPRENAPDAPSSSGQNRMRRVRRTSAAADSRLSRALSSGSSAGLLRTKVSASHMAKTVRHDWRAGWEQPCGNVDCSWWRMERWRIDPARPTGYVYRYTKSGFWTTYDRVPPCGRDIAP